jgi:hypothetical protein
MNLFLKKIALFISIAFLLVTALVLSVFLFTDRDSDYAIDSGITDLYIGDSRIELAINDSLLPNSLNLGANSESYYYSYYKLEKILRNNNSIRRVFLGIGHHSFSSFYDRSVTGKFAEATAPRYFNLLPSQEKLRIINAEEGNKFKLLRNYITEGLAKIFHAKKNRYVGEFTNKLTTSIAKANIIDKRAQFHYYTNKNLNGYSDQNIAYLKKIIALCAAKNMELIVLSTPQHAHYKNQIPPNFRAKFCEVIQEVQPAFIDLSSLPLEDDCFAPDGDHVSKKGANITTIALKKILEEGTRSECD